MAETNVDSSVSCPRSKCSCGNEEREPFWWNCSAGAYSKHPTATQPTPRRPRELRMLHILQIRGAVGRLPKKRSGIESQWHVAYSIKSVFRSFCQTPQNHPPVTVVLDSEAEMHLRTLHLDGTLLEFGSEEEEFFRSETDTEELKNMLLKCARRCTR